MVADYREGKETNLSDYSKEWPVLQQIISRKPTNQLDYQDITRLLEAYRAANHFDSKHIDKCHTKDRHEELLDISLELTKQVRKAIESRHYDEATRILKLMQEVDAVAIELKRSACK